MPAAPAAGYPLKRMSISPCLAAACQPHTSFQMFPLRDPDVELHRQCEDGAVTLILRHRKNRSYHEVSPAVAAIWSLCDGTHSSAHITRTIAARGAPDEPNITEAVIAGLTKKGLLRQTGEAGQQRARAQGHGLAERMRAILTWTAEFKRPDSAVASVYAAIGGQVFSRCFLLAATAIAIIGGFLFCIQIGQAAHVDALMLIGLGLPLGVIIVVLHEGAHALTVKHYGRTVLGIGIGWFWFGPIAFVNTSDMWLAGRSQRIAVSLAGPASDMTIAGLLACAALFLEPPWAGVAIKLAGLVYLACFANLCPCLEFDGYYALSDALGRRHLRRDAVRWLERTIRGSASLRNSVRGHTTEFIYSSLSLVYFIAMLWIAAHVTFWLLTALSKPILPDQVAEGISVAFSAGLIAAMIAGLWADMRSLATRDSDN